MIRPFVALLVAILLACGASDLAAQRGHRSSGSPSKSSHSKSYSAPKLSTKSHSTKSSDQKKYTAPKSRSGSTSTYKSNGTTYESGKTYETTGQAKVKRSESAKQKFLKKLGYKRVPAGYEVDHIKPLSEGGSDTPENMQLISKSAHKQKTAAERHKK